MANPNQITLHFIVNGEDAFVEANLHNPLHVARDKALRETNNTSRPFDEWEVRTVDGVILDPSKKIGELHLTNGVCLYISIRVAAGGV